MLIGVDAVVYPLILRFMEEGLLPNLKRLINEGAGSEAACCIPPYTPTNWATLSTGSWPGTHGAGNWLDNRIGDAPGSPVISTFDSRAITAETIWEAAERAELKSLCAAYPSAYPKRNRNGYVIVPLHRGLASMLLVRGSEYATKPTMPGGVRIELKPAQGWRGAPQGALEATLVVQQAPGGESIVSQVGATEDGAALQREAAASDDEERTATGAQFDLLLMDSKGEGYDQALLCDNKDATDVVARLEIGEWSPWIFREYAVTQRSTQSENIWESVGSHKTDLDIEGKREGSVRFKLLRLSPDGKDVRLVRSEVYPTTHFTDPASLSEEIIREVGPYFEHSVGGLNANVIERDMEMLDTILDDMRYQALWHPKAAGYVMEHYGWDIYYLHWHWPDSVAHQAFLMIEPESPNYDPSRAPAYMDVIRRSYQIMDEMVGGFLELADKNTYIMVVADHGCTADYRSFDVPRLLAQKGLFFLKDGAVDFSRSRAYRSGPFHIAVNLQGRNPQGIVEPENYEKVQEEVIDALQTWRDPDNGKLVMSFAMKKRDAQLFGYWGDRTGDVIFTANHGYFWGGVADLEAHPGATVADGPPIHSAHHGTSLPTDRTGTRSNMSTFIVWGPGIKAGYSRDPEKRGFVRLMDVVPTISHLLGFQPPKECEGTVLWDHFED